MSEETPRDCAEAGYLGWKQWDRPFSFSLDEAAYFAGETRDLAVAGADVLDIGFGSGAFLAWARERGARVAGLEINPVLQAAARARDIELLPSSLADAARKNARRFDTIVAFDMFEHLDRDELAPALGAASSMLKAGGRLALRFPNGQSPFGLAAQHGDPTHRTALSKTLLDLHLSALPLDCVRYGGVYRIGGGGARRRLARWARGLLRDALGFALEAAYGFGIPWDPVVVLVVERRPDGER